MNRTSPILAACAALIFCAAVSAGPTADADGTTASGTTEAAPAPDTTGTAPAVPGPGVQNPVAPAQKPPGEFKAWLVNTSDSTWQKRWIASFAEIPDVKQVSSVRRGEHIYTLIFMTNPTLDAKDEANVRCDLRVTAPDGTRPVQSTDMDCLQGRLNGDPAKIWLSHHILEFVSEPTDPTGTWRVDVTLRDTLRNQTLDLKTSFEVLEGT